MYEYETEDHLRKQVFSTHDSFLNRPLWQCMFYIYGTYNKSMQEAFFVKSRFPKRTQLSKRCKHESFNFRGSLVHESRKEQVSFFRVMNFAMHRGACRQAGAPGQSTMLTLLLHAANTKVIDNLKCHCSN